jgi:hypothetical protein
MSERKMSRFDRLVRFVIGFAVFIPLATIAVIFVFGALAELSQPWGLRSAPPRDENPPSLLMKAPLVLMMGVPGVGAFAAAAFVARWAISSPSVD